MYAIHIIDRIERKAGFLHVTDDLGITTDVQKRREFASRAASESTLARLRATPLHWLGASSYAATIVELD